MQPYYRHIRANVKDFWHDFAFAVRMMAPILVPVAILIAILIAAKFAPLALPYIAQVAPALMEHAR